MKISIIAPVVMAGLLAAGTASAQNGPGKGLGGQGKGYGGSPQSAEERAARQAGCLERNDGVCPQGGPGLAQRKGNGWANGHGHHFGRRDGTGPQGNAGQQRSRQ